MTTVEMCVSIESKQLFHLNVDLSILTSVPLGIWGTVPETRKDDSEEIVTHTSC